MFGLAFLSPLFLVGLAAVAIPIVLHLFRRRTEVVVDFPAVRLLDQAPVETKRQRRLREWLLLALRASALALLAFAFARPYFAAPPATIAAPTTAIALDVSFSLSAPGQFEAARRGAHERLAAVAATDRVAVLTFAESVQVLAEPTHDRAVAAHALDAAAVGPGTTHFRAALTRAAEVVGAGGRIVVVTDLQQVGWNAADEGAVPDGIAVDVISVPPPASNLALTAVRREATAVVAALHNFSSSEVRVPVRLHLDEREVAATTVTVAANAAAEARLEAALPDRGAATVTIDDLAGYQADNARYLVLDPSAAAQVVVITADAPGSSNAGLYVERALSVGDVGRAFAVDVVDGAAYAARPESPEPSAVVLLGTSSLDRRGRERVAAYLKGGGRVLLALGGDIDMATLADTLGARLDVSTVAQAAGRATMVAVDSRHPIFRPFVNPTGALGDVAFTQVRELREGPGVHVLARFSGAGPAMTEQMVERGQLLVFASDLDNRWNRFPLTPAFVPWMLETMRYLTLGRVVGQSVDVANVPAGVPAIPGVHELPAVEGVRGPRRLAVNVDTRESNPARTTVQEFEGNIVRLNEQAPEVVRAGERQQEDEQRLWQIGLLAMLVALASEGLIGRRAS